MSRIYFVDTPAAQLLAGDTICEERDGKWERVAQVLGNVGDNMIFLVVAERWLLFRREDGPRVSIGRWMFGTTKYAPASFTVERVA